MSNCISTIKFMLKVNNTNTVDATTMEVKKYFTDIAITVVDKSENLRDKDRG